MNLFSLFWNVFRKYIQKAGKSDKTGFRLRHWGSCTLPFLSATYPTKTSSGESWLISAIFSLFGVKIQTVFTNPGSPCRPWGRAPLEAPVLVSRFSSNGATREGFKNKKRAFLKKKTQQKQFFLPPSPQLDPVARTI